MRQESFGAKEHFDVYWRYCSSLRNWFVAFGVGGCILFISDRAKIFQEVSQPMKVKIVASLIVGVIAQIVLALINKWTQWYVYWGEESVNLQNKYRYKISCKLSTWFWIDILADLVTVVAFAIATVNVFKVLLKG